jgi:hypothetical protein
MPQVGPDESHLIAVLQQDGALVHPAWVLEHDNDEGGLQNLLDEDELVDEGDQADDQDKVDGDDGLGDDVEEEKDETARLRQDSHSKRGQQQQSKQQPKVHHDGQQRSLRDQHSRAPDAAQKRTKSRRNREQQLGQLQLLEQQIEEQLELLEQLPKQSLHSRKRDKNKKRRDEQQQRERDQQEQKLRADQQREEQQREEQQREEQQRERERLEELALRQEGELLREQDLLLKEDLLRERGQREEKQREQEQREQEKREQEQRDMEQRDIEQPDLEQRDLEQRALERRDKGLLEQELRVQELREQELRDQAPRKEDMRKQELREEEQRGQEQRELELREQERRLQQHRKQEAREPRDSDQRRREDEKHEQSRLEHWHREEQLLREQELIVQQDREQQLQEQQLHEQLRSELHVRERHLDEEMLNESQLRDFHASLHADFGKPAEVSENAVRADAVDDARRRRSSTKSTIKSKPQQGIAAPGDASTESAPSARRVGDSEAQLFYEDQVAFLRRRSLRLVELSDQLVLEKCTFSPQLCVRSMRLAAERSMALADKAAGVGPEAAREALRVIEEQRARRLAAEEEAAAFARGETVRVKEGESHSFSNFLERSRADQERLARWREDSRVLNEHLELEECTFHPTLTASWAHASRDVYRDLHMNGLKELAERARVRKVRLEVRANAELEACTFQPRVSHAPPPPPVPPEPIAAPPGYTQLFVEKRHAAQSAKSKVRVAKSPLKVAHATRAAQATQSSGSSCRNSKATGQQDSPGGTLWGEAASTKLRGEAARRLADSCSARVESSGKNRVSHVAAPSSPRTPTTSGADGGSAKVGDWHRFSNKAQVEFGDVVESIRRLNALLARPLPSPVRPAALYP